MAGFKKFEDILAWQETPDKRQSLVYEITAEGNITRDFGLLTTDSNALQEAVSTFIRQLKLRESIIEHLNAPTKRLF
ncbi:MAG: hypothetical protein WKF71_20460 [Pyrinomonadaceae bacterium]